MTCDEAAQLLPWLLNDSLEADERREVTAHVAACAACRRALAESRFALAAAGTHLPGEALAAVAFGEAAPGIDPALVEEHLASCPQCAADLELARTSRALADEGVALFPRRAAPAPAPAQTVGGWRAAAVAAGLAAVVAAGGWMTTRQRVEELQARAGAAPAGAVTGGEPAPVRAGADDARRAELEAENRRLRRAAGEREAEAERLQEQLAQAAAGAPAAGGGPQINAYIADLFPPGGDIVRGAADEGARIELPPRAGALVLILNAAERSAYDEHAVEVRDAGGRTVWSARGLVQDGLAYTLSLPRQELHAGTYTLDLYGLAGDRREKIETYTFTIAGA